MKSYSDFKSKQFEKLIRNLERCQRQINYIKKVDKYVYKGLVGGTSKSPGAQQTEQSNTPVKSEQQQPETAAAATTGAQQTDATVKQPEQSNTPVKSEQQQPETAATTAVENGLQYSVGDIIKANSTDVTYVILNDKYSNNQKQNVLELKKSIYNNEKEEEKEVTVLNTDYTNIGNISNKLDNIEQTQIKFYNDWYDGPEGKRLRQDSGETGLEPQASVNTDDEIAALLGEIDDPEFVKQDELKDIQDFNFSSLNDLAVTIQGLLEAARTTAKGNKSVLEGRIIKLEDIKNKLSKKILAMKENKLTANQNYIKLKESYTKVRKQLLDANNKLTNINTSFAAIN
jgi:hypothetical protein